MSQNNSWTRQKDSPKGSRPWAAPWPAMILAACLLPAPLAAGATDPAAAPSLPSGDGPTSRQVVITIDDLPKIMGSQSIESATRVTDAIVGALEKHHAPSVGFVIGEQVFTRDQVDARLDLLRQWVASGAELGNHSFSHPSFNKTDLITYEDDVLRGDLAPRLVMEEAGRPVRYFRHPYNQTGPSAEVKADFRAFMAARGMTIAPFTVEHADYLFNRLWLESREEGNEEQAERIRTAYLEYLDTAFDFAEALALETFGGAIPQIFLIHANDLNALCLDEMLARLARRGYEFIAMDQALEHPAYATPDDYVGTNGISWLHRWRHTRDLPDRLRQEPDPPMWLIEAWRALEQQAADD